MKVLTHETYRAACERADAAMKAKNGHSFEISLKTRCIYCGRSPKAKGKCRGWFMTFLQLLEWELVQ
jgi:hypothetical protein